MHAVSHLPPRPHGFTLLEAMVALAVLAILVSMAMSSMTDWMLGSKTGAAAEFYADGFKRARDMALRNNAASRIQLTENTSNGQMDWQIDLCFPSAGTACTSSSGSWSTTSAGAAGDPLASAATHSLFRSAGALPKASVLTPTLLPSGASDVYFTPVGWVDTTQSQRLTRLELAPSASGGGQLRKVAVAVTLAGNTVRCDPDAPAGDSRECPP
jgi:type IV fimbrial biogenesis protein FimT